MSSFRSVKYRAKALARLLAGVTLPLPGGGGVTIPDIFVKPASAATGSPFGPYDTESTAQTIYYTHNGSARLYFNRDNGTDPAATPNTALRISLLGLTAYGLSRNVNGVSFNATTVNNVAYPGGAIPAGTPCSITYNVDGSFTFARLDTNTVTATITAAQVIASNAGSSFSGTWVSAEGGISQISAQGNAVPITVNSLAVDQSYRPTVDINYTGVGRTGYRLEPRYFQGGSTFGPKVDAVVTLVSPGRLSLTGPINFGPDQFSTQVLIRVYEVVNGVETGVFRETLPYTMPATAPVPLTFGYNVAGALRFDPQPMGNDIAPYSIIKEDSASPVTGITLVPYANVDGVYDVVTDTGVTLSPYNGFESRAFTINSTNATTGQHVVTIAGDNVPEVAGQGSVNRGMIFVNAGRNALVTAFSMIKRGTTSPVNPRWLTEQFGKGMRDLDVCNANSTPAEGWYTPANFGNNLKLPIQAFAEKHALDPEYKSYWHTQMATADDAFVTRNAETFRDFFPDNATAKFIFEFSNEDWNNQFGVVIRSMIEAAKEGFFDGTSTAPGTKYVVKQPYKNGSNVWVCPAMSAGEALVVNNIGGFGSYNMLTAKTNLADGTVINSTSFNNPYAVSAMLAAGALWRGWRHNQCIDIYRSVLGDARFDRQVLPAVCGQQGNAPTSLNTRLNFVPGYRAKIKVLGIGGYVFHNKSTYQATSGLTPQGLAQEFLNNMPTTRASLDLWAQGIKAMGNFQFGMYEGAFHPAVTQTAEAAPSSSSGNISYHYQQIFFGTLANNWTDGLEKSSLMAALEWDYYKMITEVCTGYCFYYKGVGGVWGLKREWNNTLSHYRLDGHLAAVNGQPRPAFA